MSNGPWTDEENDLIDDIAGRHYSKAEHRRALLPLLNDRSEGSVPNRTMCVVPEPELRQVMEQTRSFDAAA